MIKILFVDDEPDLLDLGKMFLEENSGFAVDTAPSAQAALALVTTQKYDAIVSDFLMPDMDGIEFLRYIRSHAGNLPVILFTGKGREDVVIDAINNGADYYIEKGGEPEEKFSELGQKIGLAVERRRAGEKILHYNRLYAIMSGINTAVLHTSTRDDLFARICRIMLEDGKFVRAWIGILTADRTRVFPAACCGYGDQRLAPVPVTADAGPAEEGLSGRAAFTRRRAIGSIPAGHAAPDADPDTSGPCIAAAFPLWFHNTILGTIQVCERDAAFFGDDELRLFEEICSDISFALETIEAEDQRKKTQYALRESEEKFRILVEESLVGICIIRDNHFLHVNPKFARIMGYSQDEIVKTLSVTDLVAPECQQIVASNITRRIKGDMKSLHFSFKGRRKDGAIIDLEAAGTVALYQGDPILLGTIIDITERRKAEIERMQKLEELSVANRKIRAAEERLWAHIAALTESQERLNESERRMTDIINFLPDAMFAIDTEGRVLVWNRAIEKMTGIPAEDIIGRDGYEYALPFYNERRPVLADMVLHYDEEIARTYTTLTRDGEKFTARTYLPHFRGNHGMYAWFAAAPLYDMQGKIAGAIETIRDITEFEEARQALNTVGERYRSIITSTHEGVVVIRDGHIVFTNPAIRKILAGYTEEVLYGKAIVELIHPADLDTIQTHFDTLLKGSLGHDTLRFRGIACDRSLKNLESRAILIDWEGNPATVWFLSEVADPSREPAASLTPATH